MNPRGVTIQNSLFLGANVELRASGQGGKKARTISGLQIVDNQFSPADPAGAIDGPTHASVWVNEDEGIFEGIEYTRVADNVFPTQTWGGHKGERVARRETEHRQTVVVDASSNRLTVTFSFASEMVFDCDRVGIGFAHHDVVLPAGGGGRSLFPRTLLRRAQSKCVLHVDSESALPVGSQVHVVVREAVWDPVA